MKKKRAKITKPPKAKPASAPPKLALPALAEMKRFTPLQMDRIQAGEREVALHRKRIDEARLAAMRSVQADILQGGKGQLVRFEFDAAGVPTGYDLVDRAAVIAEMRARKQTGAVS